MGSRGERITVVDHSEWLVQTIIPRRTWMDIERVSFFDDNDISPYSRPN